MLYILFLCFRATAGNKLGLVPKQSIINDINCVPLIHVAYDLRSQHGRAQPASLARVSKAGGAESPPILDRPRWARPP